MAKQTFTTGQVLTAAQMTSLQQTAMLGGAANAKVASYVLVAADAGDAITMSNASATTITVNTGLFAAGDIITIINLGAGVCTITAGTATVATSGSLALAQNQGGVLRFTSASAAIFFQFATPASGDIEGVTAGTGISGGGTSGTVTITNSMATAIDAKGDLVVGTGADAFSRLAVGADGTTLVADSSVSPTGLKWAAPSAGALTLITKSTFSATASHSINNVFSATYDNYLLLWKLQGSTTDQLAMRLRVAGTDATAGNYYDAGYFINYSGSSSGNHYDNAATSFILGNKPTSNTFYNMAMHIYSPAKTESTTFNATVNRAVSSGVGAGFFISGTHQVSTAYDGFTLIADTAGNITGEAIVYGYQIS